MSLHRLMLALFAFSAFQSRASAQGSWTPWSGEPPVQILPPEARYAQLVYAESGTRGQGWLDMADKKVTVRWLNKNANASKFQVFATSYWPTSIQGLPNGTEILVAGKRRNGNTVIEHWKIKKPLIVSPVPPGSGPSTFQDAVIEEISTVYDEATEGRDMVVRMLSKPAENSAILVQYYDSKAIYNLEFSGTTSTLSLIASPATIPALATSFTFWWSRHHRERGYVYVFRDEDTPNSTLVLMDTDLDGVVDSSLSVLDSQWVPDGWGSSASYF